MALLSNQAFAGCEVSEWLEYKGTKLWKFSNSNAYFYVTGNKAIDADGAPNAYHPDDKGIDALANAGYPHGGWNSILVADPADGANPYIQTSGEFAGYFVSMTTLQDQTLSRTDVHRYVDSRQIPYLVFPGAFHKIKGTGTFGDLAIVKNLANEKETPAIVADGGPKNAKLGELSIRLAENLGGEQVNPRNGKGMPKGNFVYVVFPGSKSVPVWPRNIEDMTQRTSELLNGVGGWDKILTCIKNEGE